MAAVLTTSGVATLVWAQTAGPGGGRPDLSITKVGRVSGQTVTYAITVTNIGTGPAASPITVTDTLSSAPSGSTFVSASGSGWRCTGPSNGPVAGSGPVTCTYNGTLSAGAPALTLTVVVNVTSGGNIENCASVDQAKGVATVADSNSANNQSCATTTVSAPTTGRSDLKITKVGVASGQTVTYTLTVTNIGTATAAGPITVTDTLTPGTSGAVFSSMAGICSGGPSGPITCTSNTPLNPGAFMTFTLAVTARLGGNVTNCTSVEQGKAGAIVADPSPDNNKSCVETSVKPLSSGRPDLKITKVGVVSGQTVTYTITVTNIGAGPSASNNFVIDKLVSAPSGTTFVSASGSGWTCEGPDGPVAGAGPAGCASYSSLAPGETATMTFTINVPLGGNVTNCAEIISVPSFYSWGPELALLSDSDVSNNKACVDSSVRPPAPGRPDLKITKVGVVSGQTVTYTITVTNIGDAPAAGPITVTDTLTPSISVAIFSSYSSGCSGGAAGPITCTSNSPLAANGTLTFNIVVTKPLGGKIENCASVAQASNAAAPADANLTNNETCTTANVLLSANPTTITYVHSVKVVCGTAKPLDPVAPGTYYTAINIHNITDSTVTITGRPVLAFPVGSSVGQIFSKPVQMEVEGGEAIDIGCKDIAKSLKADNPVWDDTDIVHGFFDIFTEISLDGGQGNGGQNRISSFFDVFTELSIDGGTRAWDLDNDGIYDTEMLSLGLRAPLEVSAVYTTGLFDTEMLGMDLPGSSDPNAGCGDSVTGKTAGCQPQGSSIDVEQINPHVILGTRLSGMIRESPSKASLGK